MGMLGRGVFSDTEITVERGSPVFFPIHMDVRFKTPFRMQIVGPSLAGKTGFTFKLLRHSQDLLDNMPQYILYFYGECQPLFTQMSNEIPNITFIEGIPENLNTLIDPTRPGMLIFDDLASEISDSKFLSNLFTKGSHHKQLNVVFISQNLFQQGREMRTIALNTEYYIIFKNPRDRSQITHLAKQIHPGNVKFLQDSYVDATSEPHTYSLIDLKMSTPEQIRIRRNIFPNEIHYVYVPRKPL